MSPDSYNIVKPDRPEAGFWCHGIRGFGGFRVRPARGEDVQSLYELAKLTGGGFTNLCPDKDCLKGNVVRSQEAFSREDSNPDGDGFVFVLENAHTGQIRGTCQVLSCVGTKQRPFYSYRISTLEMASPALQRTCKAEILTLCTDFDSCSEVGGLFLHPEDRSTGLGMLLARGRYLFMKQHQTRFAEKVVATLRGGDPLAFWDAVAGRFLEMPSQDEKSVPKQFIADLMPKLPIYTSMLPDNARAAIGMPHREGRAAVTMLESEGFCVDGHVSIYYGGPTLWVATDQIRTVRESREIEVGRVGEGAAGMQSQQVILATRNEIGRFAACYGEVHIDPDGTVMVDPHSASVLDVGPGEHLSVIGR